jgi:hypothetical protein
MSKDMKDLTTELVQILGDLEVGIMGLVGDEFAPKQENGSPERKRLLGLLNKTHFHKTLALQALTTLCSRRERESFEAGQKDAIEGVNPEICKHFPEVKRKIEREARIDTVGLYNQTAISVIADNPNLDKEVVSTVLWITNGRMDEKLKKDQPSSLGEPK